MFVDGDKIWSIIPQIKHIQNTVECILNMFYDKTTNFRKWGCFMENFTNELCLNPDCGNLPISLSNYCGDHTENEPYLQRLQQYFSEHDKIDNADVSAVELQPKSVWTIKNKSIQTINIRNVALQNLSFDKVIFEHCSFEEIEIEDCIFSNCEFINCQFRQLDFVACQFTNNTFKECEWSHVNFHEEIYLVENAFHFDLFDSCYFSTTQGTRKNYFNNVSFKMCSFVGAYFDESRFHGTIFSKNSIAYSSFRHSVFEYGEDDFDSIGLVVASDFYKVSLEDKQRRASLKDKFCNFDEENYLLHAHKSVEQLLLLNHPNHIEELAYYLNYIEEREGTLIQYQQTVIDFFKKLYQIAITDNNYEMVAQLIQSFINMPESIRLQNFLLPNKSMQTYEMGNEKTVTLAITFDSGNILSLNKVSEISNFIAELEHDLYDKNAFELVSAKKGSAIFEVTGNLGELIVYAGLMFIHAPEAIFQIFKGAKDGFMVEKLRLENQINKDLLREERETELEKKKLEIEKSKKDMAFEEKERKLKLQLLDLEVEEKRQKLEKKQRYIDVIDKEHELDVDSQHIAQQLDIDKFHSSESKQKLIAFNTKFKISSVSLNIKSTIDLG